MTREYPEAHSLVIDYLVSRSLRSEAYLICILDLAYKLEVQQFINRFNISITSGLLPVSYTHLRAHETR